MLCDGQVVVDLSAQVLKVRGATRAMSSAYLKSDSPLLLQVISFVYMEKRMGDKTQPCIAGFKTIHSDMLGSVL